MFKKMLRRILDNPITTISAAQTATEIIMRPVSRNEAVHTNDWILAGFTLLAGMFSTDTKEVKTNE